LDPPKVFSAVMERCFHGLQYLDGEKFWLRPQANAAGEGAPKSIRHSEKKER